MNSVFLVDIPIEVYTLKKNLEDLTGITDRVAFTQLLDILFYNGTLMIQGFSYEYLHQEIIQIYPEFIEVPFEVKVKWLMDAIDALLRKLQQYNLPMTDVIVSNVIGNNMVLTVKTIQ